MKKKLTIPYRPWHTDKLEPYIADLADKLSRDPIIGKFIGPDMRVSVELDVDKKRVRFSFRSPDYPEDDAS